MKDQNDKATLDAFQAPRRGRPPKDSALDGATRQRQLRESRKAAGWRRFELSPEEVTLIRDALNFDHDTSSDPEDRRAILALLHKLRA